MALTTDTARNISETVNQRSSHLSPEAAILFHKSIVARPLITPEVPSIRVKNTEFYYRWVNRLSSGGRVYNERKAMGFVNATTADVEVLVGDIAGTDEEIRCGDLILMKILFERWAGHVKSNMNTAMSLQRMRGVYNRDETLSSDVFADGDKTPSRASVSSEPFVRQTGKAQPFIPAHPD